MTLSVNQTYNINNNQYGQNECKPKQMYFAPKNNLSADTFVNSNKTCENKGFLDKIVSFGKNLSWEQITKVITPQKPKTTFDDDVPPKYFEEGQKGYIPSTKGFVEEEEKTSYIPSTKPAPAVEEDLTKAKIALKNSYLAENLTSTRMKDGFRRKF